jgi:hypothetical protein
LQQFCILCPLAIFRALRRNTRATFVHAKTCGLSVDERIALALVLQLTQRKPIANPAKTESAAMSRQGPLGFGFGMLFEIAAIAAIVSLLPKFDLRPSSSAAASSLPPVHDEDPISPVGWTDSESQNSFDARPTSYYQPRAATTSNAAPSTGSFSTHAAPPLIEMDPNQPKYVEQRLDRSSQQLVNGVGTTVADAAQQWLRPITPATPPTNTRTRMTQQPTQPRPWIRY